MSFRGDRSLSYARRLLALAISAAAVALTAPTSAMAQVCGDGTVDVGEDCDDGGVIAGDCCSPTCLFEPASTVCRAAAGVCDPAEFCTGTSGTCPADALASSSTVCRGAVAAC